MKLVKSSKNTNSRYFLNTTLKGIDKMSPINSSHIIIKNNKIINSTKNSRVLSFPVLKEEKNDNKNKDKIKTINKPNYFLSTKNIKNQIKHFNFTNIKSNKSIIRQNTLNKNNNLKAFKYFNLFSGNEIDKSKDSKDIKDNSSEESNNFNNTQIKKIKLSIKNPINILYNNSLPKTKFKIHNDFLLEDIVKQKELEFDKNLKMSSNIILLKKFRENNYFSRTARKKKPILNEYNRKITISTEKKKKIPIVYNHYLTQTKNIYNNLNNTYSFLKDDIIYDVIHDKEKHYKSQEKIKRLLSKKYDEIDSMRDNIIIKNIPIVEDYLNKIENKNRKIILHTSWNVDELKDLNEDSAYKLRRFFAKKYGLEIKKNMFDININRDDFLVKFQKSLDN